MTTPPTLPDDLAPTLVSALERLLAEVALTTAPELEVRVAYAGPRCVVCHEGGKLGGHHGEGGRVEWIHRSCHRRLHRRHNPKPTGKARARLHDKRQRVITLPA